MQKLPLIHIHSWVSSGFSRDSQQVFVAQAFDESAYLSMTENVAEECNRDRDISLHEKCELQGCVLSYSSSCVGSRGELVASYYRKESPRLEWNTYGVD